jgi:hypothetical protein
VGVTQQLNRDISGAYTLIPVHALILGVPRSLEWLDPCESIPPQLLRSTASRAGVQQRLAGLAEAVRAEAAKVRRFTSLQPCQIVRRDSDPSDGSHQLLASRRRPYPSPLVEGLMRHAPPSVGRGETGGPWLYRSG